MEKILFDRGIVILFLLVISFSGIAQTTIYQESFETNGEGLRYSRSHQFDSVSSYFKRGASASFSGSAYIPSSISGSNYFSLQNPHADNDLGVASGAPFDGIVTLTINPINITSFTDLVFSIDFSCKSGNIYGPRRFHWNRFYVDVDYQIDGGGWNNLMKVSNSNNSTLRPLFYTDPPADIAGGGSDVQLTEAFAGFNDSIPGTGTSLELRIVIAGNKAGRELSFDNLKLTGGGGVGPPADGVRLLHQFCGYVTNNRNQSLWVAPNATTDTYEFEFSGGDLGSAFVENTGTRRSINLDKTATSLSYGQTYDVRTRGVFSGIPGQWSDAWYNNCQVRIDTIITVMTNPICMAVVQTSTPLYCNKIGGATNYRFRVTGTGVDTVVTTGGDRFTTFGEAGVTTNGFYNIFAASFVGGSWSSFGPQCTFQVNGTSSSTNLVNYQCNSTFSNTNSSLRCYAIPGATQYRYEISGGIPTTAINRTTTYLRLSDIPGLVYGGSYAVRIRVTVGGVNSKWGTSCNFSTSAGLPSTSIYSWNCGTTVNQQKSLCADPVGGANYYQFNFSNAGDTTVILSTNCVSFNNVPTMADGSYNIQVRAIVGIDTGTYGAVCAVTLNSGGARLAGSGSIVNEEIENPGSELKFLPSEIVVYPNPTPGEFTFSGIESRQNFSVQILNKYGELESLKVYNQNRASIGHYLPGIYTIIITVGENRQFFRIIKE
jgi:hypothetical protein